jgi:hypothetical protein
MNPATHIPIITHQQFVVLQDIASILSVLHHTQELLSAEHTPTISLAQPVYKSLIYALSQLRFTFPELQFANADGMNKIDTYVQKTHGIPVYTLALVINPAQKFDWIHGHGSLLEVEQAYIAVKQAVHVSLLNVSVSSANTASTNVLFSYSRCTTIVKSAIGLPE